MMSTGKYKELLRYNANDLSNEPEERQANRDEMAELSWNHLGFCANCGGVSMQSDYNQIPELNEIANKYAEQRLRRSVTQARSNKIRGIKNKLITQGYDSYMWSSGVRQSQYGHGPEPDMDSPSWLEWHLQERASALEHAKYKATFDVE